jgi:hypothetical protein
MLVFFLQLFGQEHKFETFFENFFSKDYLKINIFEIFY